MNPRKSQRALFSFELPRNLIAGEPPEERGLTRADVRLMAIDRKTGSVTHTSFGGFPSFLQSGDLLVFNSSRTIPASIKGFDSLTGTQVEVRLAEHLPDGDWNALLLCKDLTFDCALREGMVIRFGKGLSCNVLRQDERIPRLWKVHFSKSDSKLISLLHLLGAPVRYEYLSSPWGLEYYQNVYSNQPGSVEMPSAGRAFTWKAIFDLKRRGVESAFIVLHAGLSSYIDEALDSLHLIPEEEYSISSSVAKKVNLTRQRKNKVIAIGTTVVRALESAADVFGNLKTVGHDYTKLGITRDHKLRAVDGLLTGFHEPRASHLDLLSAFVAPRVLEAAYDEAVRRSYRWHEFGDLNLIS